jgi:hypothetical protein
LAGSIGVSSSSVNRARFVAVAASPCEANHAATTES